MFSELNIRPVKRPKVEDYYWDRDSRQLFARIPVSAFARHGPKIHGFTRLTPLLRQCSAGVLRLLRHSQRIASKQQVRRQVVLIRQHYNQLRHEPGIAVLMSPITVERAERFSDALILRWVKPVRVRLGGPRQCLRVDILPDVRQFAVSNGNGEDPMVLERLIRGFDSPRSEADDQDPVSLRHELPGFRGRFH